MWPAPLRFAPCPAGSRLAVCSGALVLMLAGVSAAQVPVAPWGPDGVRLTASTAEDRSPLAVPDGIGGLFVGWRRDLPAGGPEFRIQHLLGSGGLDPGW